MVIGNIRQWICYAALKHQTSKRQSCITTDTLTDTGPPKMQLRHQGMRPPYPHERVLWLLKIVFCDVQIDIWLMYTEISNHWAEWRICVSKLDHHWLRKLLVAMSAQSHYQNQGWGIIIWTPRNKFQWHLNRNSYIFIQENEFENIVWKMTVIWSRPQCVNICCFWILWENTNIIIYMSIIPLNHVHQLVFWYI